MAYTLLLLTTTLVSIFGIRFVRSWQIKQSRMQRVLVPNEKFDPHADEVASWASLLKSFGYRGIRGWLWYPRFVCGIRFSYQTTTDSQVALVVSVPKYARVVLNGQYLQNVSFIEATEIFDHQQNQDQRCTLITELNLVNEGAWPLASTSENLSSVSNLIAGLTTIPHSQANVTIDIAPLTAKEAHKRQTATLQTDLRNKSGRNNGWLYSLSKFAASVIDELFKQSKQQNKKPQQHVNRLQAKAISQQERLLTNTAASDHALFFTNIRITTQGDSYQACRFSVRRLIAAFTAFDGAHNRWAAKRNPRLRPASHPIALAKFNNFHMTRKNAVSTKALASLIVPPTAHCTLGNPLHKEDLDAKAMMLPRFDKSVELLPLGWIETDSTKRLVGVPQKDIVHSLICGGSGYGKTHLGLTQLLHNARHGKQVVFLDPHGDGIAQARKHLPDLNSRIVELSFDEGQTHLGWNPIRTHGYTQEQVQHRAISFIDGFAAAQRWGATNTRAMTLLTMTVMTLVDISSQLPPELAPTIFQIPTILEHDEFRNKLVEHLKNSETKEFWINAFPHYEKSARGPVTNPIRRMAAIDSVKAVLGQPQGNYDIDQAIDTNKIVFLRMDGTGHFAEPLAIWVMNDLLRSAFSRRTQNANKRATVNLYLDELQSYEPALATSIQHTLEQLRKFGFKAHFMTQNPEALTTRTLQALFTNVNLIAATRLGIDSARVIAKQTNLATEDFTSLNKYHFRAVGNFNGQTTKPISFKSALIPQVIDIPKEDVEPNQPNQNPTTAQALTTLAALNQNIIKYLDNRTEETANNPKIGYPEQKGQQ